jgi:hypothetical protein
MISAIARIHQQLLSSISAWLTHHGLPGASGCIRCLAIKMKSIIQWEITAHRRYFRLQLNPENVKRSWFCIKNVSEYAINEKDDSRIMLRRAQQDCYSSTK